MNHDYDQYMSCENCGISYSEENNKVICGNGKHMSTVIRTKINQILNDGDLIYKHAPTNYISPKYVKDLEYIVRAVVPLVEAALDMQCACTVEQRLSGHISSCAFPYLYEALAAFSLEIKL